MTKTMRGKIARRAACLCLAALFVALGAAAAGAEEKKIVGVITQIEMGGSDGDTAAVTLRDNKTQELVTVIVTDELTLDKLKDHRIVEGDEVRCRYEVKDGRNVSRYFRKTAGC